MHVYSRSVRVGTGENNELFRWTQILRLCWTMPVTNIKDSAYTESHSLMSNSYIAPVHASSVGLLYSALRQR